MDPDLVARKVARAAAWLDDVERRVQVAALADEDNADLAAFHLQLAIQECLDLAAHWIAGEGWSPAEHNAAAFGRWADRGAISVELAAFMRGASGLRNRIAQGYAEIQRERMFAEAKVGIPRVRAFLFACQQWTMRA